MLLTVFEFCIIIHIIYICCGLISKLEKMSEQMPSRLLYKLVMFVLWFCDEYFPSSYICFECWNKNVWLFKLDMYAGEEIVIWAILYLSNRVFVKALLKKWCLSCVIECNNWNLLLFFHLHSSLINLLIYSSSNVFTIPGCSICFVDFSAWLLFKAFVAANLASRSVWFSCIGG